MNGNTIECAAIDLRALEVPEPPLGLPATARSAWHQTSPVLLASLDVAVQRAVEQLEMDAAQASSASRKRLAHEAHLALSGRSERIRERGRSALIALITQPRSLCDHWPAHIGAFALHQVVERLRARPHPGLGQLAAAVALPADIADGPGIETCLAGLLDAAAHSESLPAHARNLLCLRFAEAVEQHLALQAAASAPAAPQRGDAGDDVTPVPAPRALHRGIDAVLKRLQLDMLEAGSDAPIDVPGALDAALSAVSTPVDGDDLARLRGALERAGRLVAEIGERAHLGTAMLCELQRLEPLMAKTELLSGRSSVEHPGVLAVLRVLLELGLDAPSGRDDDGVPELVEEISGEMLSQFLDDAELWSVIAEDGRQRLANRQRSGLALRHRAIKRIALRQRLASARCAVSALVAGLDLREGIGPFLEVWQEALVQIRARHGVDSTPWRRMLAITRLLLLAPVSELIAHRIDLYRALTLAGIDPADAELALDQCFALLGVEIGEDRVPAALAAASVQRAEPRVTIMPTARQRWPLRLPDGRRRYLLGIRQGAGDAQAILSDRAGKSIQLDSAARLKVALADGSAVQLDAGRILREAREAVSA